MTALRKRAESYGAKLAVNITKTVVWLATSTPDSADSKHNSARRFGIPMLSAAEASSRLDEAIREAELKAYERQREIDEVLARRDQYQAEREAYWRPTWRPVELDRDPEPEFDWY
jgi:DNA polymerase III subunit epsilon